MEGCAHPVLLPDTIGPCCPACIVEQPGGSIRIVWYLGRRIVPRHPVADAVSRCSIAVQNIFDHLLTVHPDIDCAPHRKVTGHRTAHRHAIFLRKYARILRREVESPVIHRLDRHQLVARNLLVRIRSRRIRQINLSRLCRQKRSILFHKQDRHPFHTGLLAIIIGICLKYHLLPAVPLPKQVPS